jgi:hypothetical protein
MVSRTDRVIRLARLGGPLAGILAATLAVGLLWRYPANDRRRFLGISLAGTVGLTAVTIGVLMILRPFSEPRVVELVVLILLFLFAFALAVAPFLAADMSEEVKDEPGETLPTASG